MLKKTFSKKLDLYLMKIHINFGFREKIRSENTDQFLCLEQRILLAIADVET